MRRFRICMCLVTSGWEVGVGVGWYSTVDWRGGLGAESRIAGTIGEDVEHWVRLGMFWGWSREKMGCCWVA